jgi:hypothetical protein
VSCVEVPATSNARDVLAAIYRTQRPGAPEMKRRPPATAAAVTPELLVPFLATQSQHFVAQGIDDIRGAEHLAHARIGRGSYARCLGSGRGLSWEVPLGRSSADRGSTTGRWMRRVRGDCDFGSGVPVGHGLAALGL